jgi:hypothetical protein
MAGNPCRMHIFAHPYARERDDQEHLLSRDTPQAPTSAALSRGVGFVRMPPSVLPEPIEAVGAQLSIAHRVHDVAVA